MYIRIDEANLTTLSQSREGDPVAVVVGLNGDIVLTIADSVGTWPATPVGRMYESANGELWFALKPSWLQRYAGSAANLSDSAMDALGWSA